VLPGLVGSVPLVSDTYYFAIHISVQIDRLTLSWRLPSSSSLMTKVAGAILGPGPGNLWLIDGDEDDGPQERSQKNRRSQYVSSLRGFRSIRKRLTWVDGVSHYPIRCKIGHIGSESQSRFEI
jgi:hypothetical protein